MQSEFLPQMLKSTPSSGEGIQILPKELKPLQKGYKYAKYKPPENIAWVSGKKIKTLARKTVKYSFNEQGEKVLESSIITITDNLNHRVDVERDSYFLKLLPAGS